jgi:hypothetical protein
MRPMLCSPHPSQSISLGKGFGLFNNDGDGDTDGVGLFNNGGDGDTDGVGLLVFWVSMKVRAVCRLLLTFPPAGWEATRARLTGGNGTERGGRRPTGGCEWV